MPGHSEEEQFLQIILVLKELEIIQNINYIMEDNSEINNILYHFLANRFKELEVTSK
jgi:hypothetical protein